MTRRGTKNEPAAARLTVPRNFRRVNWMPLPQHPGPLQQESVFSRGVFLEFMGDFLDVSGRTFLSQVES
jgi:hypothetical protein